MRSQKSEVRSQKLNPHITDDKSPLPPFRKGGEIGNPPTSPFIKGGQRGIIKGGLGGIIEKLDKERLGNEKGIALVMVLVLSAILLAIMAGLVYMLISGTQISGMQKRYKTALEAGLGGADITYQFIGLRGNTNLNASFISDFCPNDDPNCILTTTLDTCTGTSGATIHTGLSAKLLTSTTTWGADCDTSLIINPADNTTYDISFQLGTYNVYSKIMDTIEGNTAADIGLLQGGVTWTKTEHSSEPRPYYYTIEVDAQNLTTPERAKLSILYQY